MPTRITGRSSKPARGCSMDTDVKAPSGHQNFSGRNRRFSWLKRVAITLAVAVPVVVAALHVYGQHADPWDTEIKADYVAWTEWRCSPPSIRSFGDSPYACAIPGTPASMSCVINYVKNHISRDQYEG